MRQDPTTPAEWQEAVDLAEAMLLIDSARQYGLVSGGPSIVVDRCVELLERGRERGYRPNVTDEQLVEILRPLTGG